MATPLWLAGCVAAPKPSVQATLPPAPPPTLAPVEVEPAAPATQPASLFTLITQGPVSAMLSYSEKVRSLNGNELNAELARLGEPGDVPTAQMQTALALAQTRVPADLARAVGLLQRVAANTSAEARPLHPLARMLAARYLEQRRIEDDRDRQVAQLRDAQRRIDQLNDRIEALRAIERSFARPANGAAAAPASNGAKPAP
ncbi:hypothetical protein [Variovorax sp. PAMC 28711]|uniref:hypothetical protein n=1 Tax=Variovorax sp. PAMC 28711 TaxID=1795631 RepID=UPI001F49072E|nr:hypothetical protein [Variovorax sp. PAMC 28711]